MKEVLEFFGALIGFFCIISFVIMIGVMYIMASLFKISDDYYSEDGESL